MAAVTLTDQEDLDDLNFYAVRQTFISGNALPGGSYTYMATLDSGSQSHILSATDAAAVNIADSIRAGTYTIDAQGANGVESLLVSDPLGVFVTGSNNVTVSGGAIHAPTNTFKGQFQTAVMTAPTGSVLPSVIGTPMLGQYAVNMRNSQTRRIVKPDGSVIRTPNIEFTDHGAGAQYPLKLSLRMQDPNGAASADPAFFPSFENFDNFSDNPSAPTFWSFPIANVNVQHTGGNLTQQPFLFDTGAQVTVLSAETADAVGFDVVTDTPAFTIDVLGVGGVQQAKGFFVQRLELPVTGGSAIFTDVPVLVLDVVDPRTGSGIIPGIIGMNLFTDRDLSLDLNKTGASFARFTEPMIPQWNQNASGTWLPDANWTLGVPDGEDVPANFLGAITAARTINVDGNYTIGSMKFDNANSYSLVGPGTLTFATLGRPSKIEVVSGSHSVASTLAFDKSMNLIVSAGATLTLSGNTSSPTSSVTKTGTGQARLRDARFASLAVNQGSVQLIASTSTTDGNTMGVLQIAAGATLDLTNRPLAIDYTTTSPIATVRTDLAAGRLMSSLATANKAVGYGEASDLSLTGFGGVALVGDAVVMRLTLKGDADLNLTVGFSDLVRLAQHYNQTNQTWTSGDFNYDGTVGFADLVALAQNYNGVYSLDGLDSVPGGGEFAADWALAQSLVPEPTALFAVVAASLMVVRRR